MKQFLPCITLAVATLAADGQTKNQLQKALFAEEVEQDPAKAAAIYQSMTDDSRESPRYLAIARFRLAKIHQQAGRMDEAKALLKALASDPDAPADWVVQANRILDGSQNVSRRHDSGPHSDTYETLKDKLWYWHSGNGEPFGALRFYPEGRLEATLGVDWLAGWMPVGSNRIKIYKPEGNYWIIELSEDGQSSKGIPQPGAVDPFKFIKPHPVPSTSIEEADIEFLKKALEKQPDSIAAQKIPCRLAKQNRIKALSFLLDHGIEADLRERDSLHYTPLMYAAEYGNPGTVQFLLDRGANINAVDDREVTPLYIAAWHGRPEIVTLLMSRGADATSSSSHAFERDKRMEFGTALHGAAWQGHMEVAKLLLAHGADINATTQLKQHTPLICALAAQKFEMADTLLESGADPNLPASGLANPLRQMAFQGNLEMLLKLLKKGARFDIHSSETRDFGGVQRTVGAALPAATREGNLQTAKALVEAGCPVDQVSPTYLETPLHAAALFGNTSMCAWLLSKGANPNHRLADNIGFQSGWLPLHSATWRESPEVVKLLMEKGGSPAEPCFEAGMKRTAFHIAILRGNVAIAKAMMDRVAASGSDKLAALLSQPDSKGNSALHLAVSREAKPNSELVRLLIASGASLSAVNQSNQTPRQRCLDPELGSEDPAVRSTIGQ